jgi:glycosyltransferase involved in cell wall biosynthesis
MSEGTKERLMNSKLIIFQHGITFSGGSERITLEEEKYFNNRGIESVILTFYFNDQVFDKAYLPKVQVVGPKIFSGFIVFKFIQKVYSLRKFIKFYNPSTIVCVGEEGSVYIYCATIFTKFKYSTHMPQTIFWDVYTPGDTSDDKTMFLEGRYSWIFRKVYQEVRNATIGHIESLPERAQGMSVLKRIFVEILGVLTLIGVRKAQHIYVHSNKMKWEVQKLYKKESIVLKGAYPQKVLGFVPSVTLPLLKNVKGKKIILSICRLVQKKRVDLIIRAFNLLFQERKDIVLVIGGTGEAESDLKNLVKDLNMTSDIIFAGFVEEKYLNDYYYGCDVFVSADHADFDISTYLALGFLKRCVWSIENEVDDDLIDSNMVFPADITPASFAEAINVALGSSTSIRFNAEKYTWENYFNNIYKIDSSLQKSG